ncbi:MAG: DUF4038 domain-containing protein [Bacteroidota bacterium]
MCLVKINGFFPQFLLSKSVLLPLGLFFLFACGAKIQHVPQWTTYDLSLESTKSYSNPYIEVEVAAVFTNEVGEQLRRPGFWDGGKQWKIRFTPPDNGSIWTWETACSDRENTGLHLQKGSLQSVAYEGENHLLRHGLLRMSPGKRNVIHHDGHPFLLVGDTPWALPFRATKEQVEHYATDRQQKGFNAALLMSVQPDMEAEGPAARNTPQGFMRGFEDLHEGHINQLTPSYFQYLDSLVAILIAHEIVPVFQPVFHGYGWKGKKVLGNHVEPGEYVRYCKYLLARYGSQPAMWLIAGDNGGRDPGVKESGEMLEEWDSYEQPTGLHYNPCDDYVARWAVDNPIKHCEHFNKTYQAEEWLDFQWAQTGHSNEHEYTNVQRMYDHLPTKASANGEPTYEGMNEGQHGVGWWQGEEAWMQFMSGGTMGVVYGAATLWQWKVSPDEEGWPGWTDQPTSWDQAMKMQGSTYVGYVSKALAGLDLTDIEKRPDLTGGAYPLLTKNAQIYLSYLNDGGDLAIAGLAEGLPYRWFDPVAGTFVEEAETQQNQIFHAPTNNPWVLIIGEKE